MQLIADGFDMGERYINIWEHMQHDNYMCYGGQNQATLFAWIEECPRASEHLVMNGDTIKRYVGIEMWRGQSLPKGNPLYREVYKPLDAARDEETLKNTIIFCNYDYEL